jgi:hypothetical protein
VPDHLIETIRNYEPRPEALAERPRQRSRRSNWLLLAASLIVGVSIGAIGANYYMGKASDRKVVIATSKMAAMKEALEAARTEKEAARNETAMAAAKIAELSKALPFPLSLVSRAVENGSKAPAAARKKILAELNAGALSVPPVPPVSTASDIETLEDLQPVNAAKKNKNKKSGKARAVMPGGLPGRSTRIRNVLGEFSFAGRTCRIFEYKFQHATEASVLIACKKGAGPWQIVQREKLQ